MKRRFRRPERPLAGLRLVFGQLVELRPHLEVVGQELGRLAQHVRGARLEALIAVDLGQEQAGLGVLRILLQDLLQQLLALLEPVHVLHVGAGEQHAPFLARLADRAQDGRLEHLDRIPVHLAGEEPRRALDRDRRLLRLRLAVDGRGAGAFAAGAGPAGGGLSWFSYLARMRGLRSTS